MFSPKKMWLEKRNKISFGLITLIVIGKVTVVFGFAPFFAGVLESWAWVFILLGLLIDLLAKARWFGGKPKGSLTQIWTNYRARLSFGLIAEIIVAKQLVAFGVGLLFAVLLLPYAWWIVGAGLLIGIIATVRYFRL